MELGKYVVIEGHDGTGKSTQVGIIRKKLLECNIDSIEFHEPAGNPIADAIRTILKDGRLKRDAHTDMLLFSAARHELWHERALPALKSGKWVIASRNYYSTLAYQGYGENLNFNLIEETTRQATDEQYINPDFTFILDLDKTSRDQRIRNRGELKNLDNFESKDDLFQSKVRKGYLEIAKNRNIPIISADQTIDEIANDIWAQVNPNI